MTKAPAKMTANASQAVAKMKKKAVFRCKFAIGLLYITKEKISQANGQTANAVAKNNTFLGAIPY
jgi:hypothetical protein